MTLVAAIPFCGAAKAELDIDFDAINSKLKKQAEFLNLVGRILTALEKYDQELVRVNEILDRAHDKSSADVAGRQLRWAMTQSDIKKNLTRGMNLVQDQQGMRKLSMVVGQLGGKLPSMYTDLTKRLDTHSLQFFNNMMRLMQADIYGSTELEEAMDELLADMQ